MGTSRTFSDIAFEWLASKEGKVKMASYAAYAGVLNFNILPILGGLSVVTEEDVRGMMEKLQEQGVLASSMRNYVMVVKNVLKFGAQKGYCEYPGWTMPVTTRPAANRESMVLLSPKEEEKLVKYLAAQPTPRNLGYFLILATGLKAGELCALKWGAIDLEKGVLNVVESKNQFYLPGETGGKGKMKVAEDMAARQRCIPLPEKICDFLRPFAQGKDKDTYVITGTSVFIQRPKTLRESLKAIAKRLEIPAISLQDLRHTFAIRCIQSGCDLVTLMSLMGIYEATNLYAIYGPYFKTYPQDAMKARAAGMALPNVSPL